MKLAASSEKTLHTSECNGLGSIEIASMKQLLGVSKLPHSKIPVGPGGTESLVSATTCLRKLGQHNEAGKIPWAVIEKIMEGERPIENRVEIPRVSWAWPGTLIGDRAAHM